MAIQRIAFTEWTPDQPAVVENLSIAKNVVPALNGYTPFPLAVDYSASASENLNNVFAGRFATTTNVFAGGSTKLFKFNSSTLALDNVSKTGNYSNIEKWRFTQFGNAVIAANNKDKLQVWNLGTSSAFTDIPSSVATLGTITGGSSYTNGTYTNVQLTYVSGTTATSYPKATIVVSGGAVTSVTITSNGSGFVDTTTVLSAANTSIGGTGSGFSVPVSSLTVNAPVAKFVTVVRDFVVAAHLDGGTSSNKLQWSNINDETNWIAGAASQSDFQIIADGGDITGITGGETGLVLLERAIVRMSYIGSPLFFQFDTISRSLGCVDGATVVKYGAVTYFLGEDGFYACDGTQVTPIGNEKVDRWFFANSNPSSFNTMSATADPFRKIIVWNFLSNFGNRLFIIYNWQTQRWSYGTTDTDCIASAATAGITLEGMDAYGNMDTITTSFDSRLFAGGKLLFAGTRGAKIVTFTGANSTAEIATGDIGSEMTSIITLAKPIVDNGSANIAVASRTLLNQSVNYGTYSSADAENRVSLRAGGKYHRLSIIPTGSQWKNILAVDVNIESQGTR